MKSSAPKTPTPYESIYAVVRTIPFGKVASYGAVAAAAGLFRGARMVGWALRSLPEHTDVPWHRVINMRGEISITNPSIPASVQCELLAQEGVVSIHRGNAFTLVQPPWFVFSDHA